MDRPNLERKIKREEYEKASTHFQETVRRAGRKFPLRVEILLRHQAKLMQQVFIDELRRLRKEREL